MNDGGSDNLARVQPLDLPLSHFESSRWPLAASVFAVCIVSFHNSVAAKQQPATGAHSYVATQTAFRVRSNFDVPLNADGGWAGGPNENVTVNVDQPFRIRFEMEKSSELSGQQSFRLQYRRNGGNWVQVKAEDFPKPGDASPLVSIVSAPAYQHGEATIDLLRQSNLAYRAGSVFRFPRRVRPGLQAAPRASGSGH